MREAMIAAIENAISLNRQIRIQMDVKSDWNQFSIIVTPDFVGSTSECVFIDSSIGTIYIDTMDVEYSNEDFCYICYGINSATAVFC